jgi:hypothetical protein
MCHGVHYKVDVSADESDITEEIGGNMTVSRHVEEAAAKLWEAEVRLAAARALPDIDSGAYSLMDLPLSAL